MGSESEPLSEEGIEGDPLTNCEGTETAVGALAVVEGSV